MAAEDASPSETSQPRRRVGFVAHQLTEYLLGAALLVVGFHLTGSSSAPEVVLLVAGSVLIALAACTAGTLGAVRVLSRGAHHVLDMVCIAALVLCPLAMLPHPNVVAIVLAEAVAVLLVRIERWTNYRVAPAPAPAPARATAPEAGAGLARQLGRTTAQAGGVAGALAAIVGPVAGGAARRGARRLGGVAGAAKRAGRGDGGTKS